MKKLIMSAIMCVALMASTTVMAQDTTPKKEGCCKAKTECTKKEGEKKACKDKAAKKECTKKDGKKACCKKDKKAAKK